MNIAPAPALELSLLVCDKPVSTLDMSVQAQILNLPPETNRERSMAMLFISHSLPVVRHRSDRIVVMCAGTAVEEGRAGTCPTGPRIPTRNSSYQRLRWTPATASAGEARCGRRSRPRDDASLPAAFDRGADPG